MGYETLISAWSALHRLWQHRQPPPTTLSLFLSLSVHKMVLQPSKKIYVGAVELLIIFLLNCGGGMWPSQSCPQDASIPGAHHSANVMLSLMGSFRGLAAVAACPPSVHWAQREGRPSGDITDAILFFILSVMCTATTSCLCF